MLEFLEVVKLCKKPKKDMTKYENIMLSISYFHSFNIATIYNLNFMKNQLLLHVVEQIFIVVVIIFFITVFIIFIFIIINCQNFKGVEYKAEFFEEA